jgi:hypothetical protein
MSLGKRICLFLLVLVALAPVATVGVAQLQSDVTLRADGGAPPPPPIPPWPKFV